MSQGREGRGIGGNLHPCMSYFLTGCEEEDEGEEGQKAVEGRERRGKTKGKEQSSSYCGSRKEMESIQHALFTPFQRGEREWPYDKEGKDFEGRRGRGRTMK